MGDLIVWLFVGSLIWMFVIYALPVLVAIGVLFLLGRLLGLLVEYYQHRRDRRRQRLDGLAARADHQHHLIMSGDQIGGTYGDYLPPVGLR